MFAINSEAKVVHANTGEVVRYDELKTLSKEHLSHYGRLCVVALERDYQHEHKLEESQLAILRRVSFG
jgi:hypothetical protein